MGLEVEAQNKEELEVESWGVAMAQAANEERIDAQVLEALVACSKCPRGGEIHTSIAPCYR